MSVRTKARSIVTPLTIGSFLLMGVTGILLFFKLKSGLVTVAHEWLSWIFVIGGALHVWLNWAAIKSCLGRWSGRVIVGSFALILVAALASLGSSEPGPHRQAAAARQATVVLLDAPLSTLATITRCSTEEVRNRLSAEGISVTSDNVTLNEAAHQDGAQAMRGLTALLRDVELGPGGARGGRPAR
ncbi:MAG: DUF4405 domain-containing protein [Myxococcota bacterium]|jgi:hypothetical protein|nr:DUF4405 domain-containing protein [Myxococcota bacterium]